MSSQERLLEKLAKIKAMAEGAKAIGSEAEAQAFADMLNDLLVKHKIEMSDVEFANLEREEPVEREPWAETNARTKTLIDAGVRHRKNRVLWMERLAGVIARAHCCQTIVYSGSSTISLVGRRSDRAVADYMIVTLTRAAQDLAKHQLQKYRWEVYKRDGHCRAAQGFHAAFLQAFVMRLMERFDDRRRQREQAEGSTCTALVRIDKEQKAVDDFIKAAKEAKTLHNAAGLRRVAEHHGEGIKRGRASADAVSLDGKAIEHNGDHKKELGA